MGKVIADSLKKEKKDKKEKRDKKEKKDKTLKGVEKKSKTKSDDHLEELMQENYKLMQQEEGSVLDKLAQFGSVEDGSSDRKSNGKLDVKSNGKSKKEVVEESIEKSEDVVLPEEKLETYRISPDTIRALNQLGVTKLFPIQYRTFDHIFDGKDIIGKARTGTGKTFAFAIPIMEKLKTMTLRRAHGRYPQVLVLSPTRELAQQIGQSFYDISPANISVTCIYGGVSYLPQEQDLRKGIDVVVGTPGRINDHIQSGKLNLTNIDFVVLDEADEMLNFGFADSIEAILGHIPKEKAHQTCLFSATIPEWVKKVCHQYLKPDYITVDLIGNSKVKVAANMENLGMILQKSVFSISNRPELASVIADLIKRFAPNGRTIVFVQTKLEAGSLAESPALLGISRPIHGDLNQSQRNHTLEGFVNQKFLALLATDVAARGLDIPNVDLVIQTGVPASHETFTHRVGRTARAGKSGRAVTLCGNVGELKSLERSLGIKIRLIGGSSAEDVIKLAAQKAVESIKSIPTNLSTHFHKSAQDIINKHGAVEALSAALAVISNITKLPSSRSLIYGLPDYTTIRAKHTTGYDLHSVKDQFIRSGSITPAMSIHVISTRDGGAVIEVPSSAVDKVLSRHSDEYELFTSESDIPDISSHGNSGGYGGYGRSGGGGFRGRSFGGRNSSSRDQSRGGSASFRSDGGNKGFQGNGVSKYSRR